MKITVIRETIALTKDETLVRKSKLIYPVQFIFDSTWDGFTKTALFQAGSVTQSVELSGDACTVPAECLEIGGVYLKVLIKGVKDGVERTTPWCLTSRILYDIVDPTSVSPTPTGDIGRLCSDFADALSNGFTEEELKDKTLSEVLSVMEEDYVPTATDEEVDSVLDDIWGPD